MEDEVDGRTMLDFIHIGRILMRTGMRDRELDVQMDLYHLMQQGIESCMGRWRRRRGFYSI